ncbi:MAG: CheY-like chemotaxis protein [Myxococcota bacterium]|jgi:CheY-like chemotaxis protein
MAPLRSVLLIDDNPDDNTIHTIWLQRSGAVASREDVIVKENGLEGLVFLQKWKKNSEKLGQRFPPPLILLDINMPVMGGFEFLEKLTELDLDLGSIVLVMLTSSDATWDRQRAAKFPIVRGYVEKPLNRTKIKALLAEHFTKPL